MGYRKNVRDTAAGFEGSISGQREVERANEDSNIVVHNIDGTNKFIGGPTSKQYRFVLAPHDDKPHIMQSDVQGRA